nr:NIPSNAP family protein [Caldimonas mangrovi]
MRQYTLHPGQRETLIELFERELVHTQQALGIEVVGPFRDLDRPDVFVWVRGFASVAARGPALEAFYGGPAWQAHRAAANATMTAWHDALQLKPARAGSGFTWPARAPQRLHATLLSLHEPAGGDRLDAIEALLQTQLDAAGARRFASFVTEPAPNGYPRLPLREGEPMFVAFHEPAALALGTLQPWLRTGPQTLRLEPTERAMARMTGASA